MVTILPALRQVREDLVRILDRSTVERLCHELGHRWRDRHLDPYTTLHLFILQVLNQNTAMTHLPHLSGERFTAAAYCQARRHPGRRGCRPLEGTSRLAGRWIDVQHARHAGVASSLWPARRPEAGLRISCGTFSGSDQCSFGIAARRDRRPVADA